MHASRDDIPLLSQWIKNKTVFDCLIFGGEGEIRTLERG